MDENPYTSRPIRWLLIALTLLALLSAVAAMQASAVAELRPADMLDVTKASVGRMDNLARPGADS
jgi:hypothetical protein